MLENDIDVRTAKRGKNERQGVHNWHPYYAGYSENFVEDILDFMGADGDTIVLDPWMGSGTTALVCQKRGIKSIGIEINPVMVIFSKAKSVRILDFDINEICISILDYTSDVSLSEDEYLNNEDTLQYLNKKSLNSLNKLQLAIDEISKRLSGILSDPVLIDSIKSFFYSVLFRCLRTVGNFKKGRNPTWLVNEVPELLSEEVDINQLFHQFVESMINDLQKSFDNISEECPLPTIYEGNCKRMDLNDGSVNYIITSPPYLTRIDYAVSTKPELLFLGYKSDFEFDTIRRATMGAPVISDKNIEINETWGNLVFSFLNKVKNHETKAAKSYYLPIYLQYFRDAYEALAEIYRVLKPNGQACLVVQSSYFKEVEAKLGDMYVEMASSLGLEAQIIKREEIKQHIAHVNTKSSKYVKNKIYYEDAVLLRKRVNEMSDYSSHRDQVLRVEGADTRAVGVEQALMKAFERFLFTKEVPFISFGIMTAEELAKAFYEFPIIVKSILASVNVAARAIKRDLDISVDTYGLKLTKEKAALLAGYIKPMLPNELAIPAICELDRWFYVDKEIRKFKGSWEKAVLKALIDNATTNDFKKVKFKCDEQDYELDAAHPSKGSIKIGIDVKRIEARQDIHKRADEIINKARKFKKTFPEGSFYAIVYYPFATDHLSLQTRLEDSHIDGIFFAAEVYSSIEQQAKFLLSKENLLQDEILKDED
ncbi:DNA methyltransferase [Peribacillus sp. NPDC097225]|uniref:DNA methyltransferase n=1 Tax=Peribacillus sp. NPDC097225 TaxID=3364400 RepID=UPI00381AE586